jgi:excisionase family DNA binding protein
MTELWMSVDKIAEHLGVSRDSIYRWIDRMSLTSRRVRRLWKFMLSEAANWVRTGGENASKEREWGGIA